MAYAEDEPEEEQPRNRLWFPGVTGWTNMAEVPCFRNSFMYGIGAGVVTGVVYNLALSRNPMKLAFSTYGLVTFGKMSLAWKYLLPNTNSPLQVTISNAATTTERTSWR